jgi:uncharacterized membrane-anchored protein
MNKKQKDMLKIVSKPIWFPAVAFAKLMKEVGKEGLECVKNDDVCDIVGAFFIFTMISGMIVAFLCLISIVFLKIWVVALIAMYLLMFYVRDNHKRKNK